MTDNGRIIINRIVSVWIIQINYRLSYDRRESRNDKKYESKEKRSNFTLQSNIFHWSNHDNCKFNLYALSIKPKFYSNRSIIIMREVIS